MRAEQCTDPIAYHGEGPVWSTTWGGLRWVDMLAGDILSLTDDGQVKRRHVANIAAALRPSVGGGAVIGIERGFLLEYAHSVATEKIHVWYNDSIMMNEYGCDTHSRCYCGNMC